MDAAQAGNETVVRMLLAAGADPKAVGFAGGGVLWGTRWNYWREEQLALQEREAARKAGKDRRPGSHQRRAAVYRRIIQLLRSKGATE